MAIEHGNHACRHQKGNSGGNSQLQKLTPLPPTPWPQQELAPHVFLFLYSFHIGFPGFILVSYWFYIVFILVSWPTQKKLLCRLDPPADALELWGGICISFLDISRLWDILVVVCDRICYQPNADFEEIPSSEVQMCFISDLGSACICIQQYSMCASLDAEYINTFLQNMGGAAVYLDHSWHETDFCC